MELPGIDKRFAESPYVPGAVASGLRSVAWRKISAAETASAIEARETMSRFHQNILFHCL